MSALFLPRIVEGVYEGAGRELPDAFSFLTTLLVFMSIAAWFWSYCRAQGLAWGMDMGWFLMMAWFVVVPYYILAREGRRGISRVGLFLLTYFAAWMTGWATSLWTRLILGVE